MTTSIRTRIGGAVFLTVLVLVLVQIVVVLARFERFGRGQVDEELREEVAEVAFMLERGELAAFVEFEMRRRSKWDEMFFEVIDTRDRTRVQSANVPEGGIPVGESISSEGGIAISEAVHPTSRKGHRRIRVAEAEVGSHTIRLGRSLKRWQKGYWALRKQLAYSLMLVAAFGAITAYLVARRAMIPFRRIGDRARELQDLATGELPRSGNGDEIDRLAALLNELLSRRREQLEKLRHSVADAGHALRTPLTALRGHLELGPGFASDELRGELLEELDRLIRLVNRLLLLEKLEAVPTPVHELPEVDLAAIAEEIVDLLYIVAEEQGVKLVCRAEPVQARGDGGQLREALLNLIDNALNHTPAGGRVDVEVAHEGDHAVASVIDTGPGLSAEELAWAFERFSSRPGSSGSGLGLPIAHAIARAHGGELRASSPKGARFDLVLPSLASLG